MQVSAETTQGLERRVTITLSAKDIAQEMQSRLRSLAQTTRIAGFRPGKVPPALIQQRFGAQVRNDVVGELLRSSLSKQLTEQRWRLANSPQFEPIPTGDNAGGGDICYAATFEIYPEVQLLPMEDVIIQQPVVQIAESDVDAMVEHLRRQRQRWNKTDAPAALDDRVEIDFTGTLADGVPFEGGTGTQVLVVLGAGKFIGAFEEQLVGALPGETRTVEVTFPAEYHHAELAGQDAQFVVVVKSVENGQLPELDEAFIRSLGVAEGTVEVLRQEIHRNIERDCAGKIKELLKTQVLDWLYREHPLEVPNGLLGEEMTSLRNSGIPEEALEERARRHVALGILLGEVVQRQRIKADHERIRAYIAAAAEEYEDPDQVARWIASEPKRVQEIEALVIEDMAVEWVLKQVQLAPSPVPLSDLVNLTRTNHA